MSREEAGSKGGTANAQNHDQNHFEEIGRKGGNANSNQK